MDFVTLFTFENLMLNFILMIISGIVGYYISTLFSHYQSPFSGKKVKYPKGIAIKKQEFKLDRAMEFVGVKVTTFE